jgi:hypothetical protein
VRALGSVTTARPIRWALTTMGTVFPASSRRPTRPARPTRRLRTQ